MIVVWISATSFHFLKKGCSKSRLAQCDIKGLNWSKTNHFLSILSRCYWSQNNQNPSPQSCNFWLQYKYRVSNQNLFLFYGPRFNLPLRSLVNRDVRGHALLTTTLLHLLLLQADAQDTRQHFSNLLKVQWIHPRRFSMLWMRNQKSRPLLRIVRVRCVNDRKAWQRPKNQLLLVLSVLNTLQ